MVSLTHCFSRARPRVAAARTKQRRELEEAAEPYIRAVQSAQLQTHQQIEALSEQQEVDGHVPTRLEESQGTQATRPSALGLLLKSSIGRAVTRADTRRRSSKPKPRRNRSSEE